MQPAKLLLLIFSFLLFQACSDQQDENLNGHQSSPLFTAIENGNIEAVSRYIAEGQAVDIRDDCGWTPLMKAALNGDSAISFELLAAGASVDLKDQGDYTALLLAASNNHLPVVEALIRQGASINHQEQTRGWTALIWAAKRGHLETVKYLLEQKADRSIRDKEGKTALDWSIANQHPGIRKLLEKQLN